MRYSAFILLFSLAAHADPPSTRPARLPRCTVRIPTTTITFDMVKIPAGKVELAAEMPGRARIEEVKSIWVATTETTWDSYTIWALFQDLRDRGDNGAAYHAARNADARPSGTFRWYAGELIAEGMPARGVTYHSVGLYCKWLSEKCGRKFRLPTEAEWEYACRAGDEPLIGLDARQLDSIAWYRGNSADDDFPEGRARPPASRQPNAWGLYDMLGNVGEWVDQGTATERYAKGGSYRNSAARVNSSDRQYYRRSWQQRDAMDPPSKWQMTDAPFIGFRLVSDEDPPAGAPAP